MQGIRDVTAEAGVDPSALDQVFHGTTIATNIVIEHDGARVGMLTTEGYRDILHIARHKKPLNFSNYQDLPWQRYPIVRRRYRLTVPERITRDGSVLVPLDEERAREQVRALKEAGVESVAVCFLFSFLNPEHEARVAEIVREVVENNGQVFVPPVFWYELGNGLLNAERSGRIKGAHGDDANALFSRLPIVTSSEADTETRNRIMTLARSHDLSFYDAAYLELAFRLRCRLKSLDKHLLALRGQYPIIL